MALRMIEIYLSGGGGEWIEQILKDVPVIGVWEQTSSEDLTTVKVLLEVEKTEGDGKLAHLLAGPVANGRE